jgi:hypothetical protein
VKGLKLEGAERNPLHEQALIFAVNEPFYLGWRDGSVSGYMPYEGNPWKPTRSSRAGCSAAI